MSTWTNERHEATRELVRVVGDAHLVASSLRTVAGTLGEALDEIERLRALTTITDNMVERAADALVYTMGQESDGACWISEGKVWTVLDGTFDMPSAVRAALEAALNPKEIKS